MSQENVDFIRLAYSEGYAPRSVEGLRERFAEDFCFHMRPNWPGRPAYGLEEMTELWADLDQTYTEYHLAPVDLVPAGDRVMVTLSQSARMRGSDARVESTIWHVWEIRDGKARQAWVLDSETDALEAVGLSE
jgi:hypothetical protein